MTIIHTYTYIYSYSYSTHTHTDHHSSYWPSYSYSYSYSTYHHTHTHTHTHTLILIHLLILLPTLIHMIFPFPPILLLLSYLCWAVIGGTLLINPLWPPNSNPLPINLCLNDLLNPFNASCDAQSANRAGLPFCTNWDWSWVSLSTMATWLVEWSRDSCSMNLTWSRPCMMLLK